MLRTLWFSFPINLLEYVRHLMASQLNMWNLRKTTTDAHKTANLQKCDNIDKKATTFQDCNCMRKSATTSTKIQRHRQKCKYIVQKCKYIVQKSKYIVQKCNHMGKMRSDKLLQEWGTWGVAQWTRWGSISSDVDGSFNERYWNLLEQAKHLVLAFSRRFHYRS